MTHSPSSPKIALAALLASFLAAPAWADTPAALPAPTVAVMPEAQHAPEATDPDNCLLCHRFTGLSRLDPETGDVRLFFVSEQFHADGAGPHTSLACTGCHAKDAVEKVPHGDVAPVDCAQSCHLVSGSGTPVEFSHKTPTESLAKSVHKPETLVAQPYGTPLLREGQSACLYCHDDPAYRMPELTDTVHRGVDPTVRCQTCHDDSLPVDTARAIRHIGSRLGDERPAREAARACAVCHSDEAINEKNELHDAVTSYMRSFHGKASALGSLDVPRCVDCHANEDGNPHLMLASDDPTSPTFADNRQATCRSAGCHDDAAPDLSAAGVHMRVSPDTKTVEYYVTAAFVILTAGTMTLYFVLLLLELLNLAFRPEHEETLQATALARKIQADPEGRKRLVRLTVHQRFQHWVLVISFLLLVFTGLPMKFAKVEWMPLLVQIMGGLDTARLIHRGSALVISAAFVYHILYLAVLAWGELKERRRTQPQTGLLKHIVLIIWNSPMMVHPQDVWDFAMLFLHLLGLRKHRPAQGKFHFSQKFEYWAVFWGMTMIGTSGAMLWLEDRAAETLGGRALNFAYIVHSDEAFLALLYIAVVHFFAVIFSPAVFPLNLGSLTGDMPPGELAENHLGHLRAVAAELGIEVPKIVRGTGPKEWLRQIGRRTFAIVQAVAIGSLGYVSISFLLHEMTGGEKAIEVEEVPLRLDASVLAEGASNHEVGAGGASRDALQRGPLAHFHAIPTWYEPDNGNSCTTGGCHSALPHGDRKEVRAFLNMHTTFVDCQVCHRDADLHGTELSWLTLADRTRRDAPAVIRLAAYLDTPAPTGDRPADWDTELLTIVRAAVKESGDDVELKRWLVDLETARPGGVRYNRVIESMRSRIDRHGHGEYGTKIGIPADAGKRWAPNAEQTAAIAKIRGPEGAALHVDERKALVKTVHQNLKKPEVECSLCHTGDNGLVDFAKLGYSPARAEALRSNTIARQAQAVEAGTTFFLPSVLGGTPEATPPTAPVLEVTP